MLATAGADRSDFDSKLFRPHDAHACRVSAARDQQRARKSFVSSNQFDFNIIIIIRVLLNNLFIPEVKILGIIS